MKHFTAPTRRLSALFSALFFVVALVLTGCNPGAISGADFEDDAPRVAYAIKGGEGGSTMNPAGAPHNEGDGDEEMKGGEGGSTMNPAGAPHNEGDGDEE